VNRGFFEIGIFRGKTPANVGTLWRSAYQMGAAGIFTIGRRYPNQASDTVKAYRHIPCREFADFDAFHDALPYDCPVVAVEMGGKSLGKFTHPERAIYLLGAEDHGIPDRVLARCHHVIALPSIRTESYNVAVAGSLVMYDRQSKRQEWEQAA
jgi:tRNA G18 (ribose-2'-O)-methylase SpoU